MTAVSKEFVVAGNATFTVDNGSGNWYTFKVRGKDLDTRPVYFVNLLTGPNNEGDFTYLGLLDPATGAVRLTAKSRLTDDSKPVKAVRWALRHVWDGRPFPAPATCHHEGRCGRCGRKLTVPESIETGLGPECAGRVATEPNHV